MIRFWAVAPHAKRQNKPAGDVGIEYEPRYVDVALKRLKNSCGLDATHMVSGLPFAEIAAERQTNSGVQA